MPFKKSPKVKNLWAFDIIKYLLLERRPVVGVVIVEIPRRRHFCLSLSACRSDYKEHGNGNYREHDQNRESSDKEFEETLEETSYAIYRADECLLKLLTVAER